MNRCALAGSLAFFVLLRASAAAVPWQQSLCLANGGYWSQRVPVTITNESAEPVVGKPLSLLLPALAGARVESLRVCRADGVELLFELRDERGPAKRTGELNAQDKLIVPVECPAHTAVTLYVYAGNSQARPVPDFLPGDGADRATNPGSAGLGRWSGYNLWLPDRSGRLNYLPEVRPCIHPAPSV